MCCQIDLGQPSNFSNRKFDVRYRRKVLPFLTRDVNHSDAVFNDLFANIGAANSFLCSMSALPPKADINPDALNVRSVPIAAISCFYSIT